MIFLDIGAYTGDTARVALRYNFDLVHAFEPVHTRIDIKNDRFILHKFGLLDKDCERNIYYPGNMGGSIFKNKRQRGRERPPQKCVFKKASDWFRDNITDPVLVKINVEGAEIAILNDLIDSGEYRKIKHLLVCFDIIKVPGKEYLFGEMIKKFKKFGIDNYTITGSLKPIVRKSGKKANMDNILIYWFSSLNIKIILNIF